MLLLSLHLHLSLLVLLHLLLPPCSHNPLLVNRFLGSNFHPHLPFHLLHHYLTHPMPGNELIFLHHLHFLRSMTHPLSLWMTSSGKPKQLLESTTYRYWKSKLQQNLRNMEKTPSNRDWAIIYIPGCS
jgi:hypothetical protein